MPRTVRPMPQKLDSPPRKVRSMPSEDPMTNPRTEAHADSERRNGPAAISVSGLHKSFGDVRALDGVDFEVAPGTVFGLLGPNGAGKTTAVKVLTTLAAPDGGQGHVAGFDVLREPGKVRRAIGVVAQKSGMDPDLTGRE